MKRVRLPSTDPAAWLGALPDDAKHPCGFMSDGDGWKPTVAWNPVATFECNEGAGNQSTAVADFIDEQTALGRKLLGYVSYDTGYELHGIPQTVQDDLGVPRMYFLAFDNYLEVTALETTVFYSDPAYLKTVRGMLPTLGQFQPRVAVLERSFTPSTSREAYGEKFRKVKQYIADGDAYQVNLTHRLESYTTAPSRVVFARVAASRTSFMAYMEGSDFALHSASPERFIRVAGTTIDTFPIKGTRPRGSTVAEDARLQRELLASQKDGAELNMITDLLRNDLGKVCQTGTVELKQARELLLNATVMHTYSHIVGALQPHIRPIEALLSMFPGGSITGCPKKRAMEIIDELEPETRSVYCGSMVMIEPDGTLDSSIAIRTLIQKEGRLVLQVGGGIVHDSVEEDEYEESWHKAQGVIKALS